MNGNEMFEALVARGPHPDIAQSANAIYAPFVGSWDVEVFDLESDGARRVSRGEWHFAWILEGRAMQDVLMVPPRGERRNGVLAKGNRRFRDDRHRRARVSGHLPRACARTERGRGRSIARPARRRHV